MGGLVIKKCDNKWGHIENVVEQEKIWEVGLLSLI